MRAPIEDYPIVVVNGVDHRVVPDYEGSYVLLNVDTVNPLWWEANTYIDTAVDHSIDPKTIEIGLPS